MVDKLNLVSREILTGLPVIRAFHTEKHEEERFDKANKDLTKLNLFVNRAMTFMMPTMMLVMNGITVLIVWVGGHSINDAVENLSNSALENPMTLRKVSRLSPRPTLAPTLDAIRQARILASMPSAAYCYGCGSAFHCSYAEIQNRTEHGR